MRQALQDRSLRMNPDASILFTRETCDAVVSEGIGSWGWGLLHLSGIVAR